MCLSGLFTYASITFEQQQKKREENLVRQNGFSKAKYTNIFDEMANAVVEFS